MTGRQKRQAFIVCAAVVGAAVGYLLLQLSLGGRYGFPDQCSPQSGGGGVNCTLQGYGPRSIWVDIAASSIGASVGALVAALATRSHRASSTDATAADDFEAIAP